MESNQSSSLMTLLVLNHGCPWIKYSRFIFLLCIEYIQHHSKELCLLKAKVWVYFTQLIKHNFWFGKEPIRATWLSPTVAFYHLNVFPLLCIEIAILLEENWDWSLLVLKSLIFTLSKTHYLCMFWKKTLSSSVRSWPPVFTAFFRWPYGVVIPFKYFSLIWVTCIQGRVIFHMTPLLLLSCCLSHVTW